MVKTTEFNIQTQMNYVVGNMSGFTAAYTGMNNLSALISSLMTSYTTMAGTGRAAYLSLGAAAAAFGLKSAEAFGEYQRGMNMVKAISNNTNAQMQMLAKSAGDFSSQFRMGIEDINSGLVTLGRAGLTDVNNQIQVLQNGLEVAKISGMDLASTLEDIVTTTSLLGGDIKSNTFGAETKEVSNLLVATSLSGPLNVSDVIETLKFAGGSAAAAGATLSNEEGLHDLLGTIGAFSQKGVTGSIAGTALRAFITKPASQDQKVSDALAKLGLDAYSLWEKDPEQGWHMKPIAEQIGMITKAMDKNHLTNLDRIEVWGDIVGNKMGQQMLKLDENRIKETTKDIEHQRNLEDIYQGTLTNFASQIERLNQVLQAIYRNLGSGFANNLTPIVKGLADFLEFINGILNGTVFKFLAAIIGPLGLAGLAKGLQDVALVVREFKQNIKASQMTPILEQDLWKGAWGVDVKQLQKIVDRQRREKAYQDRLEGKGVSTGYENSEEYWNRWEEHQNKRDEIYRQKLNTPDPSYDARHEAHLKERNELYMEMMERVEAERLSAYKERTDSMFETKTLNVSAQRVVLASNNVVVNGQGKVEQGPKSTVQTTLPVTIDGKVQSGRVVDTSSYGVTIPGIASSKEDNPNLIKFNSGMQNYNDATVTFLDAIEGGVHAMREVGYKINWQEMLNLDKGASSILTKDFQNVFGTIFHNTLVKAGDEDFAKLKFGKDLSIIRTAFNEASENIFDSGHYENIVGKDASGNNIILGGKEQEFAKVLIRKAAEKLMYGAFNTVDLYNTGRLDKFNLGYTPQEAKRIFGDKVDDKGKIDFLDLIEPGYDTKGLEKKMLWIQGQMDEAGEVDQNALNEIKKRIVYSSLGSIGQDPLVGAIMTELFEDAGMKNFEMSGLSDTVTDEFKYINDAIKAAIPQSSQEFIEAGKSFVRAFRGPGMGQESPGDMTDVVVAEGKYILEALERISETLTKAGFKLGESIAQSFIRGYRQNSVLKYIQQQLELVQTLLIEQQTVLSSLMHMIGQDSVLNFAMGFNTNGLPNIVRTEFNLAIEEAILFGERFFAAMFRVGSLGQEGYKLGMGIHSPGYIYVATLKEFQLVNSLFGEYKSLFQRNGETLGHALSSWIAEGKGAQFGDFLLNKGFISDKDDASTLNELEQNVVNDILALSDTHNSTKNWLNNEGGKKPNLRYMNSEVNVVPWETFKQSKNNIKVIDFETTQNKGLAQIVQAGFADSGIDGVSSAGSFLIQSKKAIQKTATAIHHITNAQRKEGFRVMDKITELFLTETEGYTKMLNEQIMPAIMRGDYLGAHNAKFDKNVLLSNLTRLSRNELKDYTYGGVPSDIGVRPDLISKAIGSTMVPYNIHDVIGLIDNAKWVDSMVYAQEQSFFKRMGSDGFPLFYAAIKGRITKFKGKMTNSALGRQFFPELEEKFGKPIEDLLHDALFDTALTGRIFQGLRTKRESFELDGKTIVPAFEPIALEVNAWEESVVGRAKQLQQAIKLENKEDKLSTADIEASYGKYADLNDGLDKTTTANAQIATMNVDDKDRSDGYSVVYGQPEYTGDTTTHHREYTSEEMERGFKWRDEMARQLSEEFDGMSTVDIAARQKSVNKHNAALRRALDVFGFDVDLFDKTGRVFLGNNITPVYGGDPSIVRPDLISKVMGTMDVQPDIIDIGAQERLDTLNELFSDVLGDSGFQILPQFKENGLGKYGLADYNQLIVTPEGYYLPLGHYGYNRSIRDSLTYQNKIVDNPNQYSKKEVEEAKKFKGIYEGILAGMNRSVRSIPFYQEAIIRAMGGSQNVKIGSQNGNPIYLSDILNRRNESVFSDEELTILSNRKRGRTRYNSDWKDFDEFDEVSQGIMRENNPDLDDLMLLDEYKHSRDVEQGILDRLKHKDQLTTLRTSMSQVVDFFNDTLDQTQFFYNLLDTTSILDHFLNDDILARYDDAQIDLMTKALSKSSMNTHSDTDENVLDIIGEGMSPEEVLDSKIFDLFDDNNIKDLTGLSDDDLDEFEENLRTEQAQWFADNIQYADLKNAGEQLVARQYLDHAIKEQEGVVEDWDSDIDKLETKIKRVHGKVRNLDEVKKDAVIDFLREDSATNNAERGNEPTTVDDYLGLNVGLDNKGQNYHPTYWDPALRYLTNKTTEHAIPGETGADALTRLKAKVNYLTGYDEWNLDPKSTKDLNIPDKLLKDINPFMKYGPEELKELGKKIEKKFIKIFDSGAVYYTGQYNGTPISDESYHTIEDVPIFRDLLNAYASKTNEPYEFQDGTNPDLVSKRMDALIKRKTIGESYYANEKQKQAGIEAAKRLDKIKGQHYENINGDPLDAYNKMGETMANIAGPIVNDKDVIPFYKRKIHARKPWKDQTEEEINAVQKKLDANEKLQAQYEEIYNKDPKNKGLIQQGMIQGSQDMNKILRSLAKEAGAHVFDIIENIKRNSPGMYEAMEQFGGNLVKGYKDATESKSPPKVLRQLIQYISEIPTQIRERSGIIYAAMYEWGLSFVKGVKAGTQMASPPKVLRELVMYLESTEEITEVSITRISQLMRQLNSEMNNNGNFLLDNDLVARTNVQLNRLERNNLPYKTLQGELNNTLSRATNLSEENLNVAKGMVFLDYVEESEKLRGKQKRAFGSNLDSFGEELFAGRFDNHKISNDMMEKLGLKQLAEQKGYPTKPGLTHDQWKEEMQNVYDKIEAGKYNSYEEIQLAVHQINEARNEGVRIEKDNARRKKMEERELKYGVFGKGLNAIGTGIPNALSKGVSIFGKGMSGLMSLMMNPYIMGAEMLWGFIQQGIDILKQQEQEKIAKLSEITSEAESAFDEQQSKWEEAQSKDNEKFGDLSDNEKQDKMLDAIAQGREDFNNASAETKALIGKQNELISANNNLIDQKMSNWITGYNGLEANYTEFMEGSGMYGTKDEFGFMDFLGSILDPNKLTDNSNTRRLDALTESDIQIDTRVKNMEEFTEDYQQVMASMGLAHRSLLDIYNVRGIMQESELSGTFFDQSTSNAMRIGSPTLMSPEKLAGIMKQQEKILQRFENRYLRFMKAGTGKDRHIEVTLGDGSIHKLAQQLGLKDIEAAQVLAVHQLQRIQDVMLNQVEPQLAQQTLGIYQNTYQLGEVNKESDVQSVFQNTMSKGILAIQMQVAQLVYKAAMEQALQDYQAETGDTETNTVGLLLNKARDTSAENHELAKKYSARGWGSYLQSRDINALVNQGYTEEQAIQKLAQEKGVSVDQLTNAYAQSSYDELGKYDYNGTERWLKNNATWLIPAAAAVVGGVVGTVAGPIGTIGGAEAGAGLGTAALAAMGLSEVTIGATGTALVGGAAGLTAGAGLTGIGGAVYQGVTDGLTDFSDPFTEHTNEMMRSYANSIPLDSTTESLNDAQTAADSEGDNGQDTDTSDADKQRYVQLAICNKKAIPKLNVNLFKKAPTFTVLNKNFKLRDIKINTADKAKNIENSLKNAIIDVQERSDPKIIQDSEAEYDPVGATDDATNLPTGASLTK